MNDSINGAFYTVVMIFIVGIFAAFCFMTARLFIDMGKKETKEIELVSMSNGQSVHGLFFLGIGEIDGVMKYKYLYNENGSVRYGESTASCSYIKETNNNPLLILKKQHENCGCMWCSHFFIPKGSVKYNYSVDIGRK